MSLHYRHRRTAILVCIQQHDHSLFTCEHKYKEVTEAIGTGLAIQSIYHTEHDRSVYGLVHLASGTTLTRSTLPSVVAAALWLRRILPLFDWTLPQAAFKWNKDLAVQVHWQWVETAHDYHDLVSWRIPWRSTR
jgi:hypothetical protein